MLRTSWFLARLAAVAGGLFVVSLAVAVVGATASPAPQPEAKPTAPSEPVPLLTAGPAANPPVLVLQSDEKTVHGWIAGSDQVAGQKVTVNSTKYEAAVAVRDDNTFTWPIPDALKIRPPEIEGPVEPAPARIATFTLTVGETKLSSTVTLPVFATAPGQPSIFFVTDRSAYRPGHTLHFAAYLRTMTPDGEFEPVRDQEVTVDLTSQQQSTRAVRLKLRSDSNGRITGRYTFTDADALDHYALTAQGYTGAARVLLGEYRKSKVALKIKGEVTDGKLKLTFDARDFLDRRVKGTAATYTAQVTRSADAQKLTLDPKNFAHPEAGPPTAEEIERLPDDERLLGLAHGISAMTFAGLGTRFVAQREGKVTFAADGPGTVELDLPPEWLKGGHTVTVTGVLTDETGRENRASQTFPLDPKETRSVKVTTSRELIAVGEKVPVRVEYLGLGEKDTPMSTLIVVRLDPNPGSVWVPPDMDTQGEILEDYTRLPAIDAEKPGKQLRRGSDWISAPLFDPVKRNVVTAFPVVGNMVVTDLKHPGAYKLLAVTRLADGSVLHGETGVVVKTQAKLPDVILKFEDREIEAGTRLKGEVHTKFANSKLLLTLRDATGIRLTVPITTNEAGFARIDKPLPANLRYGCAVAVAYHESRTKAHGDQREIYVVPTDRMIKVTTKAPEVVSPGAEVTIEVGVNSSEPMDLIVSVYDESLLGVAGDLSGNIRDFYLGDTRGLGRAAGEFVASRLGNVTIDELIDRAESLLKNPDALIREPGLQPQLTRMVARWKAERLSVFDLATLLRLAGFDVYIGNQFYVDDLPVVPAKKTDRLCDLVRRDYPEAHSDVNSPWYLSAAVINNVVLLAQARRGADPWASHRDRDRIFHFGRFNIGGWGQPGFQGFGGLGVGGGLGAGGLGFGGGLGAFGMGGFGGGFRRDIDNSESIVEAFPGGQAAFSFAGPAIGPQPGLDVGDGTVRRDFADSAFWSANLRTDSAGKATATFKVPDSLTHWRVVVTAVSPKMHVGSGVSKFRTTRPVMVWPMLPRAFTEGDTAQVFGTVHNLTDKPRDIKVHCTAENGKILDDAEKSVSVPANGNVPVYWTYKAGKPGWTDLLMSASCDAGKDASLKRLPVTRGGVEERVTAAALVGKSNAEFLLPDGFDPATASASITIAPSLASDLADTLPYLVDYPYGCVEQTMSRFLPAIRVAQILKQSGIKNPELEKKLPAVVEAGIKRLLELQQPDGGWGWQGSSQTHEMMTPYALFGLLEAEKAGYTIPNEQAIERGLNRLRGYLEAMRLAWGHVEAAGRRPGGFNPQVNLPAQMNDGVFCLWVLAHRTPVPDHWWDAIEAGIGSDKVSDLSHALSLELAVKADRRALADKLAIELRKRAQRAGDRVYWKTAGYSRWPDNTFEVTAAALKALVAHDRNDPFIPGVLSYFQSTKRGDRWDSTKDTASVLYALCDYLAVVKAGPAAAGEVTLRVNDGVAQVVKLDGPLSKTVALAVRDLKPRENRITLQAGDGSTGALARVAVKFTRGDGADVPARNHGVEVKRSVAVREKDGSWRELGTGMTVPKGSYVRVLVTATPADGVLQYSVIESPKPACGETVPADDKRFADVPNSGHVLREDREAMTCFHHESANGAAVAGYVFLTEFAGEFRLPPARCELMYRPSVGGHSDSFVLRVK